MASLTPEEQTRLILEREEGRRAKPYQDSKGLLTIGVGHLLEKGLPNHIIDALLDHDIAEARAGAEGIPGYAGADPIRQQVVIRMVFQMGLGGVLKFKKFLAFFAAGMYAEAAREGLDSQWARSDSPLRAKREMEIMRTGVV